MNRHVKKTYAKKGKRMTRVIEASISQDNLQASVAQFLYAIGIVNDNEDVVSLKFGDTTAAVIPIKIEIQKEVKESVASNG